MSTTHNDNPVVKCELQRDQWRLSIIRQIIHSKPPKVIGIHGTWGTGKTSLMAQMYTDLGGNHIFQPLSKDREKVLKLFEDSEMTDPDIKPIWFEAWQYQHEPNILAAMLKEIRDQLSISHKIRNTIAQETQIMISSVLRSISLKFNMFGAEFGLGSVLQNVEESRKVLEKERLSESLDAVMEKRLLKEAIDQLLCLDLISRKRGNKIKEGRKAVIFIDDLDRCMPETAFRIMESIKVYLNLENCVFVLGMDLQQIEHILMQYHEKQYAQAENKVELLKNLSRLYLEKICQDIYHLPLPSESQKIQYFENLLENRLGKLDLIQGEMLSIVKEYNILPPFPRSIKIWANIIISYSTQDHIQEFILAKEEIDRKLKAFLIFTYLYAFHFEVHQLCILYRDFYTLFKEYCEDPIAFSLNYGKYPMLNSLKVPIDPTDMNQVAQGQTEEQLKSEILGHRFPDRNFRRVLWISKLVKDAPEFNNQIFNNLKIQEPILNPKNDPND